MGVNGEFVLPLLISVMYFLMAVLMAHRLPIYIISGPYWQMQMQR